MLDLVVRGGTVIDGTGAPRRVADVAVKDGRIVAIGPVDEPAARAIDGRDLVVAPGFVDTHTHHDAQLLWDPTASPSSYHGVTTVIGGNCGFTIAPLDPAAAGYLLPMLARVEGMPLAALRAGPPWEWSSFGGYLRRLEGRVAVNAGFLVGHSALRRVVMGDAAVGEPASAGALDGMRALLARCLDEGGLGFSSSRSATHHDGDGNPVPSRAATAGELVGLCGVLAGRPGTFVAFNPGVTPFDDDQMSQIIAMAGAAGAPLTWNALPVESNRPDVLASARELAARAVAQGTSVVAQVIPDPRLFYLSFANGFLLDSLPGWTKLFALTPDERLRTLRDPAARRVLAEGGANPPAVMRRFFGWDTMTLVDPSAPEHAALAGRTLGEIARSWQRDLFDVLFDLVLANGLETSFIPQPSGTDDESWRLRAELWRDPNMVIGAADAGAHLDNASSFTYTTSLLGPSVRDRGLLTLEEAVHALTAKPAALCRLPGRGRLAPGMAADLVLFDPATIGPGTVRMRGDLPGGARRLFSKAEGIHAVIVNGVEIIRDGDPTGELPGAILRSGDTIARAGARG